MIDQIHKYKTPTAYWSRLAAIGHEQRDKTKHKDPERLGFRLMTPALLDKDGNYWQRVRMNDDDHAIFPTTANSPNFSIEWDASHTTEENENLEPVAIVNTFDIDGNVTGTRQQAIGTF